MQQNILHPLDLGASNHGQQNSIGIRLHARFKHGLDKVAMHIFYAFNDSGAKNSFF